MSEMKQAKYKVDGSPTVWEWWYDPDREDDERIMNNIETHYTFDGWVVKPNFGTPCSGTVHEAEALPRGF